MHYLIALLLLSSPALACTAGGRPCDDVFREQLQTIDRNRTENMERGEKIEQRQHTLEIERLKRSHAIELEKLRLRKELERNR